MGAECINQTLLGYAEITTSKSQWFISLSSVVCGAALHCLYSGSQAEGVVSFLNEPVLL